MKTRFLLVLGMTMVLNACSSAKDEDAKMNRFLDDLMAQMTLEEKIGQLNLPSVGFDVTGPILSQGVDEKIRKGLVGGVFNTYTPDAVKKLQDIAVNESRLKIPLLFGFDVIHGHKTIFPIPLGLAASWDLDLIERTAVAAADEASADGLNWAFSPMVDIARDPRWGRVSEGSGEDPFLGSRIAEVMVKGYQQTNLAAVNTVAACLKHFALYGAGEGGRDYNTVDMSRLRMYNEYLPPYKAAVNAGVATVMTSFNEIDGIPASANKWLLTDLLRNEWGFDGLVVTDYTAIMEMVNHGIGDKPKVTELALNAGVDMDMVSEYFIEEAQNLVKEKRINEATINAACRRVLVLKYQLGLFENPYKYIDANSATRIMSPEKLALSKEAALKSMVLLKNEAHTLPLNPGKKIAFIGPEVKRQRDWIGNWSGAGDWKQSNSLWTALENKYGVHKFDYALGCNLIEDTALLAKLNPHGAELVKSTTSSQQLIQEAVQTARRSDIVVVMLGEPFGMTGEAASRSNIGLLTHQQELLKALKQTGKPIILILMNGRPLTLEWEDQNMSAILEAWYSGTQGAEAMVELLFGEANPSGKITMSFPRNVGQIPVYYNHKNTGRPFDAEQKYTSKYLDVPNDPLYPFGYGLSYTTFKYSQPVLSATEFNAMQKITLSIDITNTGNLDGAEIVQLYIRDKEASITRPVKELKAFQRLMLKAGETKTVRFELGVEELKFYNAYLQYVAEPGEFDLFVGGNSRDVQQLTMTLK